jgi:hypothetical protein
VHAKPPSGAKGKEADEARKFEWNNAIMQQLKDAERLAGRKLAIKDMLPVATRLMAQYQFSGAFEKYKGAGK